MMNMHIIPMIIALLFTCQISADTSRVSRRTRRKQQLAAQQVVPATPTQQRKNKKKSVDLRTMIEAEDVQLGEPTGTTISTENPALSSADINEEVSSLSVQDQRALSDGIKQNVPTTRQSEVSEKPYIQFNFEGADLQNLIAQVEAIYDVTFISDEAIEPMSKDGKAIKGNKISFKTQKPLSKLEAWNLFITFLDIAGFLIVPQADPKLYRIVPAAQRIKSPVPAFIGTPHKDLPDSDETIRYVYFIENSTIPALHPIIETLKSREAQVILLQENKAFIIVDKSYNIKMLMNIVKELDKSSLPQAMSILKLQRADAVEVKKLYDALIQSEQEAARRIMPGAQRKQPTSLYFPENTRIIAEPRTNTLILLGQQDSIKKIEEFIVKNVDVDLDQPYYQPYIYSLKYADAKTIAEIMSKVTTFGRSTPAGIAGGVRGGDKYLQPIAFIPQPETNQLIIKGGYDDYLKAKEIIARLDEPQPQVAIEILILDLSLSDMKGLGAQLRSKEPGANGFFGNNIKFQTSGLFGNSGIEQNPNGPGVARLLGNLVDLVIGQLPGNTILTLGQDIFGVWGVMQILETITNVQVVSNPFLVATNKVPATVSIGETRRVVTGNITQGSGSASTLGDDKANLAVFITPQITSDGMITLDLEINIDNFTNPDPTNATKAVKKIKTQTIVADKEVLALGGLIKNNIIDQTSKVPILGNIPLIGWLFKNKQKTEIKSNLLVLISTQIIRPEVAVETQRFTDNKIREYHVDKDSVTRMQNTRDPVYRMFFTDKKDSPAALVDEFLFKREGKTFPTIKAEESGIEIPSIPEQTPAPMTTSALDERTETPSRFKRKKKMRLASRDVVAQGNNQTVMR
jgi:general secretion pathway protein D